VNTYTGASFSNLKPLVERDKKGDYIFLYYIHKNDLEKEFDERKKLIYDIYETANEALTQANISRSLQYYYYSLILLNSIPERNVVYKGVNLRSEIPLRIQSVLDNVKIYYDGDAEVSESLRTVKLRLEFEGKPVQLLDFSYLERGSEYRNTAREGRAACDLAGASVTYTSLDIEIEYRFDDEKECIPLVAELWKGVRKPTFNNRRKVSFEKTAPKKRAAQPKLVAGQHSVVLTNQVECPVEREIKQELDIFLDALGSKDSSQLTKTYGEDKFLKDKLSAFTKFNRPDLIDQHFNVELHKTWDGWEIRGIPVTCRYPTIDSQSVEYLVLDFDNEGRLVDLNFNVFNELHNSYVTPDTTSVEERLQKQTIVKFLEKYRTAFMNRDIETLDKIFSDKAVIIVGRLLEPGEAKKAYGLEKEFEQVEYLKFTKQEYLDRQKQIFRQQRDIHLGFNTFRILKKDRNTDVYGISMRQQYASSGYADEGHLFLLIDFMDKDPLIYIRSWQPAEWSEEQMLNMSDFNVLD